MWRLGDDLAARLPWQTETADALLLKEHTWVAALAPRRPLPVPVPQRPGRPSERYPHPWIVTTWVAGTQSASNGSGVLAIGLDNGDVLVRRGSTDMKLHVDGEVRGLDVSGDGQYVAVSAVNAANLDDAPSVSLFDLSSGEHRELTGHSLFVDALRFSPNGRLLAGGSDDRGIHLWDSGSAEEVDVLSGHNDLISTLVWADDRILVSGAQDATVRIWDAMTGESVGGALVSGRADDVTQVDLDDDHIVAAQGNYLVTWEFGARSWIARACDAVARPLTAGEWSEFFDRQQVDSCAALRDSPPVFAS